MHVLSKFSKSIKGVLALIEFLPEVIIVSHLFVLLHLVFIEICLLRLNKEIMLLFE
jgi:hypothetical protein